jgi:hypothetical protein
MTEIWIRRVLQLSLITWSLVVASESATANVIVVESNVDGIQIHQELADDHSLDIPYGGHLLVLTGRNGALKQVAIKGPRLGTVKDLLKPEPIPDRLWNMLLNLTQTASADQSGLAGTRGRRPHHLVVNDTPLDPGDVVCVEQGTLPTIVLAGNAAAARVSADHGAHSVPLEVSPSGASWPSSVPIEDDVVYQITDGTARVDVTLRVIPAGTLGSGTSVQTLDALETRGCQRQLVAMMRKVIVTQQ